MIDEQLAAEASRQAAEMILQDERLTSGLEDREADTLLRWAVARARQIVCGRLARGQPVDRAAVAEAVRPVRRRARAVNDLVAGHEQMSRHELLDGLLSLLDSACPPGAEGGPPGPASSSPSAPSPPA